MSPLTLHYKGGFRFSWRHSISRAYIFLYVAVKRLLGLNLRGLGFFSELVKTDRVLSVKGRKYFFNHRVARAYGLLLGGLYNEPETHRFLEDLLSSLEFHVTFIDVGAGVGEFLTDVARYANVTRVVGFEPSRESAEACLISSGLNGDGKATLIPKLCNADGKPSRFRFNPRAPGASHMENSAAGGSESNFPATCLDFEFPGQWGATILLVDVEGAELEVLKGGGTFITRNRPLIIFEYNETSRNHFSLDQVERFLGPDYECFRLRGDGRLDKTMYPTWNIVAVPNGSPFHEPCRRLIARS